MRFPRVKAEGQSFYHCISRVVDRQFIFQTAGHGSPEAERFVLLMRRLEAFSGVRVLTYVLMSNHFHLLCEVPQAQELSEAELLDRIQAGYGPARRQALDQELALLRQEPDGPDQIQRLLQPAFIDALGNCSARESREMTGTGMADIDVQENRLMELDRIIPEFEKLSKEGRTLERKNFKSKQSHSLTYAIGWMSNSNYSAKSCKT